jgi:hypothetical protein
MLFFDTCRWGISTVFVRIFLGASFVPNVFSMIPNLFSIDSMQVPNYVPMCFLMFPMCSLWFPTCSQLIQCKFPIMFPCVPQVVLNSNTLYAIPFAYLQPKHKNTIVLFWALSKVWIFFVMWGQLKRPIWSPKEKINKFLGVHCN